MDLVRKRFLSILLPDEGVWEPLRLGVEATGLLKLRESNMCGAEGLVAIDTERSGPWASPTRGVAGHGAQSVAWAARAKLVKEETTTGTPRPVDRWPIGPSLRYHSCEHSAAGVRGDRGEGDREKERRGMGELTYGSRGISDIPHNLSFLFNRKLMF
uniref:Uncharacterized protein n=1 Tax=Oryza meridionalis TaxID=40149 RepID=A0A0E0F6I4_9ORYZ